MNSQMNQTGKKIQNYIFNFSDFLGQGNFSKCYRGYNQITNQIVAIKIVQLNSLKSQKLQQLLFQQIEILKKLNHPSVLKCYQIFTSNRNCYIITQLCNQGNLQNKLRQKSRFQEYEAQPIIRDVYNGLLYLSENNIVHRDFKSANIFLNNGRAKIADFGFAKEISHNFKDLNIGSPLYMAPQGILYNVYGPKTQVWALGILVYELFHGRTPYCHCKTQVDLKRQVMIPLNWSQIRQDLSNQVKQFILTCLEVNQNQRVTIQELKNIPYIKKILQHDVNGQVQDFNQGLRSPSKSMHLGPKQTVNVQAKQRLTAFNNNANTNNINIGRQNNYFRNRNEPSRQSPSQRNNKVVFRSVDTRNPSRNHQTMVNSHKLRPQQPSKVNLNMNSPNRSISAMQRPNNFNMMGTINSPGNGKMFRNQIPQQQNMNNQIMFNNFQQNPMIDYNQQQMHQQLDNALRFTQNSQFQSQQLPTKTHFGDQMHMNNQSNTFNQANKHFQGSNQIQNHFIVCPQLSFKQSIFFIHHCRLLFKFLFLYKQYIGCQMPTFLKLFKYLMTILKQLVIIVEKGRVIADGQKGVQKIRKLIEVAKQYYQKYEKYAQQGGNYIEPQICSQTSIEFILSESQQLQSKLNDEIFQRSRNNSRTFSDGFSTEQDQNLLIMGHLSLVLIASLLEIKESIRNKDYQDLTKFKHIQYVLNIPKDDFSFSNYQNYKEKLF